MIEIKTFKTKGEWLKNRENKIGGSDASSIFGLNPYKSNVDLWREKTGRRVVEDISSKEYVRYGTEAEKYLRELFVLDYPQYALYYKNNNMFLNDKYPHAHASLDGWLIEKETGRKGILEIKTTNILQSMQKEKWDNKIPNNYYIQILHYFIVTEYDFAILKAQLKSEFENQVYLQTKHYKIERQDVEEDIQYLLEKELEFMKCIETDTEPSLILPEI